MKIYSGKIVDVTREVKGGWTIGTATLEASIEDEKDGEGLNSSYARPLVLQYQACLINLDSKALG